MQQKSIQQSLLLWAACMKQIKEDPSSEDRIKKPVHKIESCLQISGIMHIELLSTLLTYYTIQYVQNGKTNIMHFTLDELKNAYI